MGTEIGLWLACADTKFLTFSTIFQSNLIAGNYNQTHRRAPPSFGQSRQAPRSIRDDWATHGMCTTNSISITINRFIPWFWIPRNRSCPNAMTTRGPSIQFIANLFCNLIPRLIIVSRLHRITAPNDNNNLSPITD